LRKELFGMLVVVGRAFGRRLGIQLLVTDHSAAAVGPFFKTVVFVARWRSHLKF
jgi:hypothetical protein